MEGTLGPDCCLPGHKLTHPRTALCCRKPVVVPLGPSFRGCGDRGVARDGVGRHPAEVSIWGWGLGVLRKQSEC